MQNPVWIFGGIISGVRRVCFNKYRVPGVGNPPITLSTITDVSHRHHFDEAKLEWIPILKKKVEIPMTEGLKNFPKSDPHTP
jgi:hypothetical protein